MNNLYILKIKKLVELLDEKLLHKWRNNGEGNE